MTDTNLCVLTNGYTHQRLTITSYERIAQDTLIHLEQLRAATRHTPSDALASMISDHIHTLRTVTMQHVAVLNMCNSTLLRLPHELLEIILSYAASGQSVLEWVKYGQVCSGLRQLLLGMRDLWANAVIFPSKKNVNDALLERAGPSALIRMSAQHIYDPPDAAQFLIDHVHRARSVYVKGTRFLEWFSDDARDSLSLPLLREIDLVHDDDSTMVFEHSPQLPGIDSLKICNIYWNFHASALTTLGITFQEYAPAKYTTFEILDVLRGNIRLQEVRLINGLPYFSDAEISGNEISLSSLSKIHVQAAWECAVQFWRLLVVPTSAKISFSFTFSHEPDTYAQYKGPSRFEDAALFKRHLKERSVFNITALDAVFTTLRIQVSSIPSDNVGSLSYTAQATPSPTLELFYDHDFEDDEDTGDWVAAWIDAFHWICAGLDLFDLTHLQWDTHIGGPVFEHWFSLLTPFAKLTRFDCGLWLADLCTALTSAPASTVLLPRLRELTVDNMILRTDGDESGNHTTVAEIVNMISMRSVRGHPLDLLRIDHLRPVPACDEEARESFVNGLQSQFPHCGFEITWDKSEYVSQKESDKDEGEQEDGEEE